MILKHAVALPETWWYFVSIVLRTATSIPPCSAQKTAVLVPRGNERSDRHSVATGGTQVLVANGIRRKGVVAWYTVAIGGTGAKMTQTLVAAFKPRYTWQRIMLLRSIILCCYSDEYIDIPSTVGTLHDSAGVVSLSFTTPDSTLAETEVSGHDMIVQ